MHLDICQKWKQMLHEVRKTYAKTLYTMDLHLHMHFDILNKMERYLNNM